MIRVVLVDDQMLVRSGIRGLLELTPDIRVVAEAADGLGAVAVIAQARPDVVLLDVRMPHCSGIDLLLREQGQLPPTILLTTFDDDAALFDGMRAGAKGFLLKDISLDVRAGEVVAIAGVAGNGQSEFFDAVSGERILHRDSMLQIDGKAMGRTGVNARRKAGAANPNNTNVASKRFIVVSPVPTT